MGNTEIVKNEENKKVAFEENKKEYFSFVRKNVNENIKEIVTKLNTSNKGNNNIISLGLNDLNNEINSWQAYLSSKLKNYKARMNPKSMRFIDDIINFVDNLCDSNENHVLRMKLFLSNQMEETRSKVFLIARDEEKNSYASIQKNAIIQRSIDFIFENLDDVDHPINKVIKNINFNLSVKYEKELYELEKKEKEREVVNFEERKLNLSRKQTISSRDSLKSKESSWSKTIGRNLSNISLEELNKFYLYVKEEISNVSFILILTLIKFYNIIEEPEFKIIDIIGEKVKDLLISGEILRFLQKIKYELKKETINRYNEKFLEYYNILPQDLGISPYFSFDNDFKTRISKKINIETLDNEVEFCVIPYFKSIIYFREISKVHSIIKKLEIMINLRDIILQEIDIFWKGLPIQQKKRYVDADNLLSVFIYLIIKSQLTDLIIDIEIIDDFINKSLKLSRKGYFFSLVQSSFEYLLNTLNSSQVDINRNEYKSQLEKEFTLLETNIESLVDLSFQI